MLAAVQFLLLMLIAAILAVAAAAGLFVGISAANELRDEAGSAVVFIGLWLPCFALLAYVLLRQRERVEN